MVRIRLEEMRHWQTAASVAALGVCALLASGCRDDGRLSTEEFVRQADAVGVRERRTSSQAMSANEYERFQTRLHASYAALRPPKGLDASFDEFLRGLDDHTELQLEVARNPRAQATLVRANRTGDLAQAGKILSANRRLAALFIAEELAATRVEVARLRLGLECGAQIRRPIREARVHNQTAPICALYPVDLLAQQLGVSASEQAVARALRTLTGLPRLEPACLEGLAFQRRNR
jgi:hypothetical protein